MGTDDEDELDDEPVKEGDSDKEPDIFELEGTTAEIDLDPTKFQDGEHDAVELRTGEIAEQRTSGRGGFEGEAQDNEPTTSGRTPVRTFAVCLSSFSFQLYLKKLPLLPCCFQSWSSMSVHEQAKCSLTNQVQIVPDSVAEQIS